MAGNNANVSSEALTGLQSDLRTLSSALHELFDTMNADMSNVTEFWQDQKYQDFVAGFQPQINKCEEISQRYNKWCSSVLQEAIDKVVEIEMANVGGDAGSVSAVGGSAVSGAGAVGTAGVAAASSGKGFNIGGVNIEGKKATKAKPISNGCGSEVAPISFKLADKFGIPRDARDTGTTREEQIASCDQHDKDYHFGVPKEQADGDFAERSPFMAKFVAGDNVISKVVSNLSYKSAQKNRETSELLQPKWEEENQQCLDSENYKVTHNK